MRASQDGPACPEFDGFRKLYPSYELIPTPAGSVVGWVEWNDTHADKADGYRKLNPSYGSDAHTDPKRSREGDAAQTAPSAGRAESL
ncbi:hypothetical protein PCA10_13060 [Metapseudomonas resinovorans NBRC 106553]|uniref:Uncharacterized protein n=1 Tax=Metapseudomonas resinovorans NBRC 106553 TaxID=1245471 RepID=S6ANA3_METRE|nr:hypothetical protein PCA10_13060 [Pseudomonas resinovorans NBRC 106553]